MSATSPLNVHTAEVTTAAVEIKTLTIRGKQVTLAVFRQLQEQQLVLDDGTLAGFPWGRVNYCPDKSCASVGEHHHVVWQLGDELRRSRVVAQHWWTVDFYGDGEPDGYLAACAGTNRTVEALRQGRIDGDRCVTFRFENVLCSTTYERLYDIPRNGAPDEAEAALAAGYLKEVLRREKDRRRAIDQRYQELSDLPQLFIAV